MGGPKGDRHVLVIPGPLVLVPHDHGNRGAKRGFAIQQATENFHLVRFLARCGDVALAWLASVQFGLNRLDAEVEPWWTALNNDTHPSPVGFTEGADPEEVAEAAAHGH